MEVVNAVSSIVFILSIVVSILVQRYLNRNLDDIDGYAGVIKEYEDANVVCLFHSTNYNK